MHLMLMGAPASGKGTQSRRLTKHFKIYHISTGDMLRSAVAQRSELGLVAETYLRHGRLVPDKLVLKLVKDRLDHDDISAGFIMDGFPRTLNQTLAFEDLLGERGFSLDAVILIEVPDEVLLERITGRRADPETGRIYHLKFAPPPPEIVDRLQQREDDTPEAMQQRLSTYHREISPVIQHYECQNMLLRVDGTLSPEQVFARILSHLEPLSQRR